MDSGVCYDGYVGYIVAPLFRRSSGGLDMQLARRTLLLLVALIAACTPVCRAAILPVYPDGAGLYPTIQSAINAAAPGDTVRLAGGLPYRGDGNRDLDYGGKALVVCSASDDPATCIIDCQGSIEEPHRGFWFHSGQDSTSVVRGLTITGGAGVAYGGGILCGDPAGPAWAAPLIEYCVLDHNAANSGSGLAGVNARSLPIVRHCVISNNDGDGVAFEREVESCLLEDCKITANTGDGVSIDILFGEKFLFRRNDISGNGGNGIRHSSAQSVVLIKDCSITANHGWGTLVSIDQGGICNITGGNIERNTAGGINTGFVDNICPISNCLIAENGGPGIVGGIWNYWPSLDSCIVRDNADDGYANFAPLRAGPATDKLLRYPEITNCEFVRNGGRGINLSVELGPGAYLISGCLIACNASDGISIAGLDPHPTHTSVTLRGNTIAGNHGAGIVFSSDIPCSLATTIIANNQGAGFDFTGPVAPVITCTNIYGNTGGDWPPENSVQPSLSGNFSANPCFCDSAACDYTLSADSWCLPGHHPWGCDELVGALGEGCPARGCDGVVPVLVANFAVRGTREGVAISWRVNGDVDAMQLRLLGSARGENWEVPFEAAATGSFAAVDHRGLVALSCAQDAGLAYMLQMPTGSGWMSLHRQEVAAGDLQGVFATKLTAEPNPFNPVTTLRFALPAAGAVRLAVYDVAGRLIRTLVESDLPPGDHEAVWDGRDSAGYAMASGSYLARLFAGGRVETARMSLVQ